jgi:hypothetical protein
MKKFFLMISLAAVFFTGLGGMLQETTAKFKSDEKALALLQKARQAIGGEASLAAVNSLAITGKSTRTFKIDGADRIEQGEMELALQFPDKMVKIVKMGHDDAATGEKTVNKQVDVIMIHGGSDGGGEGGNLQWKSEDGKVFDVEGGKKIIVKTDGDGEEAQAGGNKKVIVRHAGGEPGEIHVNGDKSIVIKGAHGQTDEFPWQLSGFARTSLSLLLTAPQGTDVSYLYAGEGTVDGTVCNIVEAQFGGTSVKLFLGKDSNLPVMMSYQGEKMPMMFRMKIDGPKPAATEGGEDKIVRTFTRQAGPPELSEFQVRFSDYRSVNGVLLPYKWTQTVGGQPDEITEVSSYEINPANIADKFKMPEKVMGNR